MTYSLSRKELYDCVWSEPRKTLAQKFGVSDVAIGKACRKVGIPVPERGYWAKKQAGKKTVIPELPPRFPGGSDKVAVGKYNQYSDWPSDTDILNKPLPQPPSFDEDLATVRNHVIKMVGKAAFHRIAHRTHPIIRKFLDQDEGRRKEYENNQYSWYEPKFNSPHEKRRLRILNAIFLAVESHGCKPYMSTSMYDYDNRDSSIHVGDQNVHIVLKTVPQKGRKKLDSKKTKKRFCFSIERAGHDSGPRHYWEDAESDRLESLLTTIVIEIIMTGELQYREYAQHRYTYLVEYKAELEEEERKKILEEGKRHVT